MSQIRSFFVGLPLACGVEPKLAKIYGEHLGALFDYEVTNPDGHFNRGNFSSVAKRMGYAFHGWTDFADPKRVSYAIRLSIFAAKCYAQNAKGLHADDITVSREILLIDEEENAEVSALLTVEQASTLSSWI